MAKELSIEEAFGTAPTSTATSEPKELSIAEAFGTVPAEEPKKITTIKQDQGNSFLTDALDFIKQVAGPVVGAIPTVPRGIEQGIRGGLRASAEGQPSSIMPSSVYNPALDTEEDLFGPETEKQTAQRKLGAQRALAQIPEIPGLKALADIGHRATENIQKSISPEAKKAIKESTPEGNLFKGELSFGKNPSLYGYALQGANVFGSLLPVIVGTMVTKDPNTGAVIGAGMAADEASSNAADTINKLSNQQLAEQSPFYAQMLHGGASPKEARDLTIRKAAETGAALQGVVAGFGDKFVGHLISGSFDKMIEKLTGKSILAKTAATGAISSLEEGTTETGEGVASNVGLQSVLPNTELGEGSAANFALGALGGAGPGVVKGALSGIQDRLNGEEEEVPTKEPYTPAQPQTSAANTYQMPSGQQAAPNPLQREQQVKQEVSNPIPPVPSFTSAPGAYSANPNAAPINAEVRQVVDANGEIIKGAPPVIQKEAALKQEIEHPGLNATSAVGTPELTHPQFGGQVDPETGEILDMPTATNVPNTSAPAIEQQEKIQTETARLVAAGFPLDAAKVMAEKTVNRETNKKEEPANVTTSPTAQVTDEIVNAKIEERAIDIAYKDGIPYKDAYKQAYKEIKGEPNAAGPNTQPAGTSVQTPGQPTAVQRTTSGAQGAQRNGVVSGNQNAPSNNVGKAKQPAPIVFKEDLETPELTDEEITQRLKDQALKEEEQNKPEEFKEEQTTTTTTTTPIVTKKRGRPISENKIDNTATKAQNKKADAALLKIEKQLDKANEPIDLDELVDDKDLKDKEELKRVAKKEAIKELLDLSEHPDNQRGSATDKRIQALLNDRKRIPANLLADIKKGREILKNRTSQMSAKANIGKPQARFSGATNAVQALTIINRVGNVFERFIAGRLQRFVQNVKFVVLEDGDPLPEQLQKPRNKKAWDGARGLFIYDPKTKERTVYVKGISFGENQGVNVITVLHEIIHAATNSRIEAGLLANYLGGHGNSNLRTLIKDLNSLMVNAADRYEQLKAAGKLPEGLQRLVESTLDEEGDYKIFTLPHEFLAYGMSSPELQAMLKGMEGKRKAGFSGFVQMIMEALGVGKADVNAFTDLIDITDKSLKAKLTKAMKVAIGEQENFEPLQATKLKAVVSKGEKAVAASQVGRELSTNLSALQMLRNPSYIWDSVQASLAGLSEGARKFISHAYDSEALAYGGPGTVITELQNTHKLLQHMSGMSQNILTNAGKQANNIVDFFREFPDKRKTFEDLINGTTIDQYDPSKPQAKNNLTYDTWYASLGQKGQDVYNGLKQYYSDMRDYQQHLLEEQIKNLKLPPAEEQKLLKALQDKFDADKIIEPYFPLMRYGDYVLEFGKGKNRVVLRYETLGERDLAARRQARKLRKSFSQAKTDGDIKISNDIGSTKLRGTIEGTSQLLKSVYEAIDTANLQNPGAAAALKDNVYQAYLSAMPEQSIRKLFMHRTGVAGFSPDIIKNVNNMGIRMSNQFAKLKYGAPLRNSLETARGQLEGREEYTPFVARMAEFVGEAISPTPKSDLASYGDIIAGGLTKLSFLHYMTSWSSAILQPLDIFLKGVPILTASHGPRAVVEISKMAKLWDTFGITEKQANGTTVFHAPSIEFAKGLTPMQRQAVQELRNFDVTRSTLTNEVFRQAQTPVSKVDSKGVAIAKLAGRTLILGGLMHHGERISREVIYLASYNLTREEGLKAGVQPGENYPDMLERVHNEAVDKAVQETNETFGNYSAYNRPMIMRGALGKIVTQYKFFPLVTTKLLVGNFFKIMSSMNKEGKVEAATKFFGIMGTHLLFGGLVALPLFSTVMGMLGAAWRHWGKDDDAPDDMKSIDFETWFRTIHLPELFGDTKLGDLSELVERGLLNKLTGLDISSRISLNDLWFRDPAPGKDLKASVQNWGMTLGGAGANYALSFAKGLQSIGNGDYEQGIEAIAPGSISSLLAAHRESQEGIKNSQGHTLVEKGKVGPGVIAGQAVGFKSDVAQSEQNAIFKADAADRQIYQERQGLTDKLKEYKQKSLDEDKGQTYQNRFEDKYQQVLDRIQDFNTRNPEKEITTDEMVNTLVDARKKFGAAESNQGIPLTLKNARLLGPIRDTLESREPK
jgi:hypothetical protein